MSLEDDTDNGEVELKELVTQTLEENGLLARIRAQLRAGLYLALETDINKREQQSKIHGSLKSKLAKPDIRTIFCLVHEFLEYFELKFTLNVFERETELGTIYSYENRDKLIHDLDIGIDNNAPILLEILNIARSSFNLSIRNESINKNNDTYDVPSEKDSYISSNSNSDVSQHVIDIKTVPKDSKRDKIASNSNSDVSQYVTDIKDSKTKSKRDKNASESSLSHITSNSNVSQYITDIKDNLNDSKSKRASESSMSQIASNSNVSQYVIDPKDNLNDSKTKLNRDKIASESILSQIASNSNVSQYVFDHTDNLNDSKTKLNRDKITTESSLSHIASNSNVSHIIDVKTVSKDNLIDSKSKLCLSHLASNSNSDVIDLKAVPNDLKSKLNDIIASESHVSQHVIDIKTVPKDKLIDSQSKLSLSNDEIDSESILSHNSDVIDIKTASKDEINDINFKKSKKIDSEPIFASPKFLNLTKIAQLDEEQDDTYEGTSSIAEDSIIKDQSFLIDFDRSIKNPGLQSNLTHLNAKTLLDQTISETPKSAKISGNSTSTNLNAKTVIDQPNDESAKSPRLSFSPDAKKHDKSDRKPMSGLSSLADLPPLQLNKNRNTLPSLYSKDFREKNALKDVIDNYDDDFSTSSAENESPRIKLSSESNDEDKCAKTSRKEEICTNKMNRDNKLDNISARSTASSISEDLNSNIDDILKSTSS